MSWICFKIRQREGGVGGDTGEMTMSQPWLRLSDGYVGILLPHTFIYV